MKSCERNEMKKSLGNSQICQHHIQHKILGNLVTFHPFLKISRRDFSLVALSVGTGSEVSWDCGSLPRTNCQIRGSTAACGIIILVVLFPCSSDSVIIYDYAELELIDVIGDIRFSRLWQYMIIGTSDASNSLRVWAEFQSLLYVRDKEAYILCKLEYSQSIFQQSQRRACLWGKSDRGR